MFLPNFVTFWKRPILLIQNLGKLVINAVEMKQEKKKTSFGHWYKNSQNFKSIGV